MLSQTVYNLETLRRQIINSFLRLFHFSDSPNNCTKICCRSNLVPILIESVVCNDGDILLSGNVLNFCQICMNIHTDLWTVLECIVKIKCMYI